MSVMEGICLVAIGVAMVELKDGHRFARPGISPDVAALATAAKPATASSAERLNVAAEADSYGGGK